MNTRLELEHGVWEMIPGPVIISIDVSGSGCLYVGPTNDISDCRHIGSNQRIDQLQFDSDVHLYAAGSNWVVLVDDHMIEHVVGSGSGSVASSGNVDVNIVSPDPLKAIIEDLSMPVVQKIKEAIAASDMEVTAKYDTDTATGIVTKIKEIYDGTTISYIDESGAAYVPVGEVDNDPVRVPVGSSESITINEGTPVSLIYPANASAAQVTIHPDDANVKSIIATFNGDAPVATIGSEVGTVYQDVVQVEVLENEQFAADVYGGTGASTIRLHVEYFNVSTVEASGK